MKLGRWSTTAASNNSTPPDGWPEGQAPSTVNDCAREMMAAIRTAFQDLAYVDQDLTPTFATASSFTVPGDQTSAIHAGRRLKIFDATAGVATTIYATVATASFTAVTTIHISADGGQLTSSLSSFAISIIPRDNSPLPNLQDFDRLSASAIETTSLSVSGDTTVKGNLTVSGQAHIGQLSVGGAAALGSTLTVSGAAALLGNVFINGNLSVSGQASVQNLSVSGTAVFTGAFVQINSSFFQVNTTLTVSGATVLKGALSVGGNTVFGGNLSISGSIVVGINTDLTISLSAGVAILDTANTRTLRLNPGGNPVTVGLGGLSVDGATNISSTFSVDGATVLKGALSVGGAATFASTLSVSGAVALNSTLTVSGATTLLSTLTVSGALTLTSGQINFPAAQNASAGANTLDDYEEGTWTPGFSFGNGVVGIAYSVQEGRYTKVGNTVHANGRVVLSGKGASVGQLRITGLPFSPVTGGAATILVNTMTSVVGAVVGQIVASSLNMTVHQQVTGTHAVVTDTNCTTSSEAVFSITYFTA